MVSKAAITKVGTVPGTRLLASRSRPTPTDTYATHQILIAAALNPDYAPYFGNIASASYSYSTKLDTFSFSATAFSATIATNLFEETFEETIYPKVTQGIMTS